MRHTTDGSGGERFEDVLMRSLDAVECLHMLGGPLGVQVAVYNAVSILKLFTP